MGNNTATDVGLYFTNRTTKHSEETGLCSSLSYDLNNLNNAFDGWRGVGYSAKWVRRGIARYYIKHYNIVNTSND